LEIPQWRLDSGDCCQVHGAENPAVDRAALQDLKLLLQRACSPARDVVVQAQHPSAPGGADARITESTEGSSNRVVSPTPAESGLAKATAKNQTTDRGTTGATAASIRGDGCDDCRHCDRHGGDDGDGGRDDGDHGRQEPRFCSKLQRYTSSPDSIIRSRICLAVRTGLTKPFDFSSRPIFGGSAAGAWPFGVSALTSDSQFELKLRSTAAARRGKWGNQGLLRREQRFVTIISL
jgi:hypothetical protein